MQRWVFSFKDAEGGDKQKFGGKGASLAEMTSAGMPVPPGFIISTDACLAYLNGNETLPEGMWEQVQEALTQLESTISRQFGSSDTPLLVSVRSGAAISMPGMMDTILNLGLNDETVAGLAKEADPRFAYDCYRRLIQMFSNVVMGVSGETFEDALDEQKRQAGVTDDYALPAEAVQTLVEQYKQIFADKTGQPFPQDPREQLRLAVIAVFKSWNNRRAKNYRRQHNISDDLGTAVNVQAMVFGNMGDDCATGVAFTRNPSTGESGIFGEYLPNAQGEDVVAGVRTPLPIQEMANDPVLNSAYEQLLEIGERLEKHYRDMQDVEFTIQQGQLYMLQTRTGKRTGLAAVTIALDLVSDGVIDEAEAVKRVEPDQLDQLLHPMIDPDANPDVLTTGLPASPGAASGAIIFDADEAKAAGDAGKAVILVRQETSPEDFHGMVAAKGVLTARGGMTSHAAVVARGMGKPCVAGASDLEVNYKSGEVQVNGRVLKQGESITIDGATGRVMAGEVATINPEVGGDVATILEWADRYRKLDVRANADTGPDAKTAREFGATGIGLCRTEHMFFGDDRLLAMRRVILAQSDEEREAGLTSLLELQRQDFEEIFEAMDGYTVTIRTLDPPLHEFLPHGKEEIDDLAKKLGLPADQVEARVAALREVNPMLGHRGCRLGIMFPAVTEMQARAIATAAINVAQRGVNVHPEIMIPLVANVNELRLQKEIVKSVVESEISKANASFDWSIGTMIELPRAALTAGEIAQEAAFFSFGTNDLTQTTYGLSRDDAGRFLPYYVEHGIFPRDPFVSIDPAGVGRLIEIATKEGRAVQPDLELGICGEHGGDPDSVAFCHATGLDYVSCSPYRVPIARLAAAQAALSDMDG